MTKRGSTSLCPALIAGRRYVFEKETKEKKEGICLTGKVLSPWPSSSFLAKPSPLCSPPLPQ